MKKTRPSAVSGYFYPAQKEVLKKEIESYLENANGMLPKKPNAIISPHAGYVYSGPIAGYSYKVLVPYRDSYKKILILGPSHYEYVSGIAYTPVQYFETPLGMVEVDTEAIEIAKQFDLIVERPSAHQKEHSIEVQIPFLQFIFSKKISIIPLAFGKVEPLKIFMLLKKLWSPELLILISSDLSHYYSYEEASELDRKTSNAILNLDPDSIKEEQACGRIGIQGLLLFAKEKNWKAHLLDLRNSGDTAGRKNQVVGYGAWGFTDADSSSN
ncbi:MAG: AmmeMemoRadiSam system protein B [Leptonema sp. (in: bacteria)]